MGRQAAACVAVTMSMVSIVAPASAAIDADQVQDAIRRGVTYLKGQQSPRGSWSDYASIPGGVTALCTLALLNCGVETGDKTIEKALAELRKLPPQRTYSVALQTMVFCAATPDRDRILIHRSVQWLERTQIKTQNGSGGWSYPGKMPDNSNSQFAALALHEAERIGVAVDPETWRLAADYWRRGQNADGSWGYYSRSPGTGSMTSAGITSMVITTGKLTEGDATVEGERVQCCGGGENEEDAVQRGLAWLARNFSVQRNAGMRPSGKYLFYYLYGIERVGRMTARRFIGSHDWYREGAEKLVQDQDGLAGFWKGSVPAEDQPQVATALALLFLSKGRRPVLVSKLRHGPGDDWNNHRNDLANLTAYTESLWQRDLTWQVIDSTSATVVDLLQTPVLFVSGSEAPQLTAEEKRRLRDYIDRGGFLFAENCCDGDAFDRGFRALMEEIFPEPEYRLHLLPPEHPVWRAEMKVDPKYLKPLWGIEYGCRTSVVYCPEDLSCFWELRGAGREQQWPDSVHARIDAASAMGVNVLTYATGRQPRYKDRMFVDQLSELPEDNASRGTLSVAKLLHSGGCDAAPRALANLLTMASRQLGMRVDTSQHQLAISDPKLFRYHLAFMHGRHAFRLTGAERKQIAEFVERGGVIMADAICASPAFTTSFRQEMKTIFPDRPLERIAADDPLFTDRYGGYDITTVSRRDPQVASPEQALRARVRSVAPDLEGVCIEDRYGVIFSPYDISCALERHDSLECNGYVREDAARIALNVLLYSLSP